MKQEDFFVAIAFTFFVENCLDLTQWYLRNVDISKVLVIFFPKINQFTCDKIFITFAQMGQAFIQAVLLMSAFEERSSFRSRKMCVGVSGYCKLHHEYMAVPW